jgi:hypothetical protein
VLALSLQSIAFVIPSRGIIAIKFNGLIVGSYGFVELSLDLESIASIKPDFF